MHSPMKSIAKRIIQPFLWSLLFIPFFGEGQPGSDELNNLHKYWYYRERLQHFVIPGCNWGESNCAAITNKFENGYTLDFGQNGIYFGYYLGTLATEYYLLKSRGQSEAAFETEQEMVLALQQYIHYMDKSESMWYCDETPGPTDIYDGFFTRNCVPDKFLDVTDVNGWTIGSSTQPSTSHFDLITYDLENSNIWDDTQMSFHNLPQGHPGWYDNQGIGKTTSVIDRNDCRFDAPDDRLMESTMSIDEVIGVLMGLALVYNYMPDATTLVYDGMNCSQISRDIALKMLEYVNHGHDWRIFTPCSNCCSFYWPITYFEYGIAKISEFFSGPPTLHYFDNVISELYYRGVWEGCRISSVWGFWGESNVAMAATLAAIGDSWGDYTYPGIRDMCDASFVTYRKWQGFYIMLYKALHPGVTVLDGEIDLLRNQLNIAPGEGPFSYDNLNNPPMNGTYGGWAATYKWRKIVIDQNQGSQGFRGNYSGLDYMLAYNLYLIAGLCTDPQISEKAYHQNRNIRITHYLPYLHTGNNSEVTEISYNIYSQVIANNSIFRNIRYDDHFNLLATPIEKQGKLSIKASNITLQPGFFAEKGSMFHASIDKSHKFFTGFNNLNYGFDESLEFVPPQNMHLPCDIDKIINKSTHYSMPSEKPDAISYEQSEYDEIDIYPNPTTQTLTIDLKNSKINYLCIFTVYGEELMRVVPANKLFKINLGDFPPAIYFLYLMGGDCTRISKIVKQ